jgi:hypothetical protein
MFNLQHISKIFFLFQHSPQIAVLDCMYFEQLSTASVSYMKGRHRLSQVQQIISTFVWCCCDTVILEQWHKLCSTAKKFEIFIIKGKINRN